MISKLKVHNLLYVGETISRHMYVSVCIYKGCSRSPGTILKFIVLALNKSKLLKSFGRLLHISQLVLHIDKV